MPVDIDPIRPGAAGHRSLDRIVIPAVTGAAAIDLGLAPALLVGRVARAMRAAPDVPNAAELVSTAGKLFAETTVDSLSPADYTRLHADLTGVPVHAARRALRVLGEFTPPAARPTGPDTRRVPRGRLLAVLAPGNHPLPHVEWLIAVALGYRVLVRPSTRDPLTPARLVRALHLAGLPETHAVLLPTTHDTADRLVTAADLALIYGDDDTVARHRDSRTVKVYGPGRAKILVGPDWESRLDLLVDSVSADGGVQCLNTTTILVDADPDDLADALAARLRALPRADLPRLPLAEARWHAARLGAEVCTDLGDGSAVLHPTVLREGDPTEVPFPCVWVRRWDGTVESLRDTLVLGLCLDDPDLVDRCAREPSIRNVHVDRPTTAFHPILPHDGELADFLLETKTVLGQGR